MGGTFHNLEIYKECGFSEGYSYDLGNGETKLSNYQFKASMKDNVNTPSLSHDFKFKLVDSDRTIQMYMDEDDTRNMIAGNYVWDLLVTDPEDNKSIWLYGNVTVKDSATKSGNEPENGVTFVQF